MLDYLRRIVRPRHGTEQPVGDTESLRALLAVAAAAAHAETGDLLELVCQRIREAYGARHVCVHLDNPAVLESGDVARGYATCPVATQAPAQQPRLMAAEATLGRHARERGFAVIAEHLAPSTELAELAAAAGFHGGIAVPLAYQGETLGTINVYTAEPRPAIDAQLLAGIGAVLYGAIKRRAFTTVLERVSGTLKRYLPPELVEKIIHEPETLATRTTFDQVTVLFSDIRGFTALAERTEPEQLSELLSEHLATMAEAVFSQGGMIDKYLGDAVMAVFGAPFPQPDHARRALSAALEMQTHQREFSERWRERLGRAIEIGIGIHTGAVAIGNVGHERRAEYAVIGDTVNVASRLKDFAQPNEILVSEATATAAGDEFPLRRAAELTVRGRSRPVVVYAMTELGVPLTTEPGPDPTPGSN